MSNFHVLKCDPEYFDRLLSGNKRCEIRKNDRNFQYGDRLLIYEYDRATKVKSGRQLEYRITDIVSDFEGLTPGWVALSLLKSGLA